MHWQRYAILAISCLVGGSGFGQERISFHFENGVLSIPIASLADFRYETDQEAGVFRLDATSAARKTKFLFFNRAGDEPLAYEQLMAECGLVIDQMEPLADANGGNDGSLRRVHSDGGYDDQIVDFKIRNNSKGSALFVLVGEDEDFYTVFPTFTSMANRFQFNAKRNVKASDTPYIPEVEDSFWEVVVAILLLVANIWFIWFGFRELARTRAAE